MRRLLLLAVLTIVAPLGAQSSTKSIAPGMSRAKVVAVLGEPATVRSVAEFTYLFYQNSCAKRCGMNDLVVLRGDSVVDAIFREPSRHYTGSSSSPAPISSQDAARAKPSASATPPIRMKPPTQANDARPSIPSNPPTVRPTPSTSPATRSP
ncbi:MAG: hypothetical protein JWL95_1224 [Gemmatimonadetes bacterium]|nr:hypothetical protein [Gemmatimonadota bacterium]